MAGKVTIGHVSQTLMVLHLRAQGIGEGDEHLPMLSCGAWLTLPRLDYNVTATTSSERITMLMCVGSGNDEGREYSSATREPATES